MKYKIKVIFFTFMLLIASQAISLAANDASNSVMPMHRVIIKFLCAMGGVAVSSLILYLGLTFYNKLKMGGNIMKPSNKKTVLETPKNIQEAVDSFINQNKL